MFLLGLIVLLGTEPPQGVSDTRWCLSLGYSGAICYTGGDFVRAMTPGQEYTADFTRWLYWLNSIRGRAAYWFNNDWAIALGGGYSWTTLKNRTGITLDYSRNQKTAIECFPLTLSILNSLNSDGWNLVFDVNYYVCNVEVTEVNPYWDPPEEFMHAVIKARGFGVASGLEWRGKLLNKLFCLLAFSGNIGFAKEYNAVFTPADTRRYSAHMPLRLNFSGLYLNAGIVYEL